VVAPDGWLDHTGVSRVEQLIPRVACVARERRGGRERWRRIVSLQSMRDRLAHERTQFVVGHVNLQFTIYNSKLRVSCTHRGKKRSEILHCKL
jgi:hypothetical protein